MSKEISKEISKQLAKCPFCGGEAKLMRFPKCERKYVVICENEQCMASIGNYSYSKEKAIEAWNTRKPMENIVELLEEELHLSYKEKERCVCLYPLQFDEAKGYARGIANAIVIVKEKGGMNE